MSVHRPAEPTLEDRLPRIDGDELEDLRCIPDSLLQALGRSGLLRMAVPQRYGGDACDLATLVRRLCRLARLDASTAWNVMVWAQGQIVLAYLPRTTYERVLAEGPDIRIAATSKGTGMVHADGRGYRLSGSWSFASGIGHSRWVLVHCEIREDERPRSIGALVSCEEVTIEDVWHVLGLRATGSNVIRAEDVRLGPADLYEIDGEACTTATAHSRLPIRPSFSLHQGAVAIGTAEGALDDLLAQYADGGADGDSDRNALLRVELGTHRSDLDAAKAALYACTDTVWTLADRDEPIGEVAANRMWATGVRSVQMASEVVLGCFRASGPVGLFDGHPLQRRLRDILTIAQHSNVASYRVGALGASLLAGR